MNTTKATDKPQPAPAVGAPLDRGVRPVAQVPVHPRDGRLWANVRPAGAETPVPSYPLHDLYDQAELEEAVAAERERCANICDGIGAGYTGAARRLDGQHATHAAGQRDGSNECAAAIRRA
jgi:hypothetical protein